MLVQITRLQQRLKLLVEIRENAGNVLSDLKSILTPGHTQVSCVFKHLAPENITHLIFSFFL